MTFEGTEKDKMKVKKLLKGVVFSDARQDNEKASKRRKLDENSLDFDAILNGDELSDIQINHAQRILKSQFPELKGFQSTLLQSKKKEKKCIKIKI